MRITLVAPTPPDVAAFGVRALSAYLKRHKKDVRLIFLPGGVEKFKHTEGFKYQYEKKILDEVVELCRGSSLVGISFMSNYLDRAVQLCGAIKAAMKDVPLIAGGIHPTVAPLETLMFTDMVCLGEGEEALLELAGRLERNEPYHDIRNIWGKKDGHVAKNPLRPLIHNLDELPYYDFGPDGHFIYDNVKGSIEPMTKELLKRSFPLEPHVEGSFSDAYKRTLSYKTMTTRGCPHHCTFCAEKTLADMYGGQKYLRRRSTGHVMGELMSVKKEMPFVESIFLFDDTFLARSAEDISEFAKAYKTAINLPFHIQASPGTVTEEKVEALVDAGLAFVEMGIQSTSVAAKDLYKRKVPSETILRAAEIFHRYRKRIYPPCYHVILDNPWESSNDVVETINLVLRLPRPFWLKRASLVCFPGTELYHMAKRDGIIKNEADEQREIYSKHLHMPKGSYFNFLMYLAGFSYFPRCVVRFLSGGVFLGLFDRRSLSNLYTGLNNAGEFLIMLYKGIRSLLTGDFPRLYRFFIKSTSKTA
ncbi:MAG: radical SAM protein [Deltaproteobacteria bacterium]